MHRSPLKPATAASSVRSCASSTTICSIPSNRSSFSSSWTFCHAAVAAARCGAMSASALAPIAAAADNVQMLPHTLVRLDDPSVRALVEAEALGIGTPGPGGMFRSWRADGRRDVPTRDRQRHRMLGGGHPRGPTTTEKRDAPTPATGTVSSLYEQNTMSRSPSGRVTSGTPRQEVRFRIRWSLGGGNRETEIRFLETLESRCSGTIPLRRVLWAGRT